MEQQLADATTTPTRSARALSDEADALAAQQQQDSPRKGDLENNHYHPHANARDALVGVGHTPSDHPNLPSIPRTRKALPDQTWPEYTTASLSALLLQNKLNLLMPLTAVAYHLHATGGDPSMIFLCSLLAIAPFAERLSYVTEQLALHTSETLGGLLNATFGNVTELIVSLFALRSGLFRIVQVSLLGSILSNLLLVLGCAFFAGGVNYKVQTFNRHSAAVNAGLLALSVLALIFPMMLHATHEVDSIDGAATLFVSRVVSAMLLLTYCCYIYFQLETHTHLYDELEDAEDAGESDGGSDGGGGSDDDDDDVPVLGMWGSIFWLAVITVFISFLSEWMVDSLEESAEGLGVPDLFLGTIVIPIVGNAAEHAAAIIFAAKNKMELAIGIAVGSSIQIAIFVVPLLVIWAWALGLPLSLDFQPFETAALLVTVILVGFIIQNGESNWLHGVMLCIAYFSIAASFYVHRDPPDLAYDHSAL